MAATAVGEVVGDILEHIGIGMDVLFVFATLAHAGAFEDIAPALQTLLSPKLMVGCLAEGVIGRNKRCPAPLGCRFLPSRCSGSCLASAGSTAVEH